MKKERKFSSSQLTLGKTIIEMTKQNYILTDVYDTGLHWITDWEKW